MATSKIEFWHHHVGISVPNLELAVRWYGDAMGFECERRWRVEAIPANVALIRNGEVRIELFQPDIPKELPYERLKPDSDMLTMGTKHCAFAVEDVLALAAEFERRGVDIVTVKTRGSQFGGSMFIRDRFGTLIEFVQIPHTIEPAAAL